VTNWPEYDASLGQRGSLTVWFTDDATAVWRDLMQDQTFRESRVY
jgi:hypothetical protein